MILTYLLIPLILLLCGGDVGWWQAWVYSVLVFTAGIISRLWAERLAFENSPGVKSWDKVLAPLMAISVGFPLITVAGLDHRYGWSPVFPLWMNILSLILVAAGYAFAVWALAENRFCSSVVRIQSDRGHEVCDSGPYRIVRHPGYTGNILALPGNVLVPCQGS